MCIRDRIKDDSRSEGIKLDASLDQPQEALIREKTELHDNVDEATTKETESQENIKEEPMDKRERETLAMLSKFQERIKNKNILKWNRNACVPIYVIIISICLFLNPVKHKNFYRLVPDQTEVL